MAKHKYISTPELMWELFEAYKAEPKQATEVEDDLPF